MLTETWLWVIVAVYVAVVVLFLWFGNRAYRQSNGYDMDSQHQAVMTVTALLWPVTIPLMLIVALASVILRSGR